MVRNSGAKGCRTGFIGALCAALLVCASGTAAQSIGQLVLTPDDMRDTALGALSTGNPARALALSEALLVRDETDPTALELAARAALAIEQSQVALGHATTLYGISTDRRARFIAARMAALANTQLDRYTAAQIWLRRARQFAPDASAAASVATDFQALRQRNPWSVQLNFGISPSSNINNGTSASTFDIDLLGSTITLPFADEAQDLSGYEVSASARVGYRLSESADHRTTATFGLAANSHFLSDDSKDRVTDFDVSDLNSWQVSTGLQTIWASGAARLPTTAAINYSATFVDGDIYASDVQLGFGQQWRVGENAVLVGSLGLGRTSYRETDADANIWSATLGWQYATSDEERLSLTANVGRSSSDASLYDYRFQSLGMAYDFGRIADRYDVRLSGDFEWRTYGSRSGGTVTREDETTTLGLSVGLPQIEFYGFMPVVGLTAERRNSSSERYQTEELAIDLNFRSSF